MEFGKLTVFIVVGYVFSGLVVLAFATAPLVAIYKLPTIGEGYGGILALIAVPVGYAIGIVSSHSSHIFYKRAKGFVSIEASEAARKNASERLTFSKDTKEGEVQPEAEVAENFVVYTSDNGPFMYGLAAQVRFGASVVVASALGCTMSLVAIGLQCSSVCADSTLWWLAILFVTFAVLLRVSLKHVKSYAESYQRYLAFSAQVSIES